MASIRGDKAKSQCLKELLLGWENDPGKRNVFGLMEIEPELVRSGFQAEVFGNFPSLFISPVYTQVCEHRYILKPSSPNPLLPKGEGAPELAGSLTESSTPLLRVEG